MTRRALFLSAIAATALSLTAGAGVAQAEPQEGASAAAEAATHLYSGAWTKKSFKSSGTWTIYQEDGRTFVKLSSDFRTRSAPDLKIFLSPLAASETTGKNATEGAFRVAELTSNAGEQIYEIPASVNLNDYQSILIHCEQYSKLWSASDLNA
ncbi:MAG: DM13 domain-containing protein [Hyphococcus sp.]